MALQYPRETIKKLIKIFLVSFAMFEHKYKTTNDQCFVFSNFKTCVYRMCEFNYPLRLGTCFQLKFGFKQVKV